MTKEEKREYMKEYRVKNKNKIAKQTKEYNIKHKDNLKEYWRGYYASRKDKWVEYWQKNKDRTKERRDKYHKEYYKKNKDKLNEKQKVYNQRNRDKILKRLREYGKLHSKTLTFKESQKKYRTKPEVRLRLNAQQARRNKINFIRVKEQRAKHRQTDKYRETRRKYSKTKKRKEYIKEYMKVYSKTDKYKGVVRNARHKRRAKTKQTDITTKFLIDLKQNTSHCEICGKKLKDNIHLDHIIPLNIGGTHTRLNVRYVHAKCNLQRPKNGSDIIQFKLLL